jgi:hypothetical protein
MSSRNWKEYNEQLVRRGEALLDFDFLKGWGVELKEMNAGKRGKPYDSLVVHSVLSFHLRCV